MTTPNDTSPLAPFDLHVPTAAEIGEGYRQFMEDEVDIWHFPMMNDTVRNAGYDQALGAAIKKAGGVSTKRVLDIGSGSGLLAMMAARQGAAHVTTVEAIPMIARKAREIIQKNGYGNRIELINKMSTNISVGPGKEMSERADILVTEIFDDGLLGEGSFVAINHAREHLLKPDAQLIPAGVRVMAICFESQEIFENHRVGEASGFDLSPFNEFTNQKYMGYHLDKMKHRALTVPKQVFEFNFYDLPGNETIPFEFEVKEDGTCHGIAFWYELQLDETTMITTAPGLPKLSCWKQAILLNDQPRILKKGEIHKVKAHHDTESLWFTAAE